jgi:hypothetical protein
MAGNEAHPQVFHNCGTLRLPVRLPSCLWSEQTIPNVLHDTAANNQASNTGAQPPAKSRVVEPQGTQESESCVRLLELSRASPRKGPPVCDLARQACPEWR